MTTPDIIRKLNENEVFVFGSNLAGFHGAGAAKTALVKFGAHYGKGEGLQGQSYAFPTLGFSLNKLKQNRLEISVDNLYKCCRDNPNKNFLLTKVGCGLAGFTEDYMKSLFIQPRPVNLIFPQGW